MDGTVNVDLPTSYTSFYNVYFGTRVLTHNAMVPYVFTNKDLYSMDIHCFGKTSECYVLTLGI